MGKGSRNRALHTQDSIAKPYKAQAKKKAQAPQWLLPLFIIVILAAVVFVAIFSAVSDSGVFPRNRVLIKSQSGKYDVTQQTATFVAWQSLYTFYSYYYEYLSQSDSSTASSSIPEGYTKETYPVALAQYGIENSARDCVEDVLDDLLNYVAVCDKAYAEGMTLTEEDQAEVEKEIALLKNLQEKTNLSTFNIFLRTYVCTGMKEKDVRHAVEMAVLYNKYRTQLEDGYAKAVTMADLEALRDANPQDYYQVDYLTFAADNQELADKLKACTTKQDFLDTIVTHHFDTNYNKLFTRLAASKDFETIEGKTNNNGGTELTAALDSIGADALATLTPADLDDTKQSALEKWLFDTKRRQYETGLVTDTDGVYVVAFLSESASKTSVQARMKFFAFADAPEAHDGDDAFKASILAVLLAEKRADLLVADLSKDGADIDALLTASNAVEVTGVTKDSTGVPKAVITQAVELANAAGTVNLGHDSGVYYVVYIRSTNENRTSADVAYVTFGEAVTHKSASRKSDDLTKALGATGADLGAIMTANGAVEKTGVTEKSTDVPSAVIKKIFTSGAAAGNIYTANESGVSYVIYLKTLENKTATVSYVTLESDDFYVIVSDLNGIMDQTGAYPSTPKTVNYTPDAAEGTLEAWASQVKSGTVESLLKEFDTTVIETTKDNVKTYNVYMVVNKPMYLDTFRVINGSYAQFSGSDHAAKAAAAIEQLQGKTGKALTDALLAINANASTSSALSKNAIPDKKTAEWLFDQTRQANEVTAITTESGNSTYVAIYLDSMLAWQSDAKNNYVESKTNADIDVLKAAYTVNQKVLKWIGETSATTAAETTSAS